jgi:predicted ribonuclease YlaK
MTMACRIAPKLDALVTANQIAFVRGRAIQHNFMLVSQSAKITRNGYQLFSLNQISHEL